MTIPPVLYRWLDDEQADLLLCGGGLSPTWTHLTPDSRRLEKGICFGEDAWSWKEEHDYTVCIALSTDNLPEALRPIHLDGNLTFRTGIEHHHLRRKAREATDPDEKSSFLKRARALAAELKKSHDDGGGAVPDEWFLRGEISDALERIVGMVVLSGASYRLRRLVSQGIEEGEIAFPVAKVSSAVDNDPEFLESEMREAFSHLIEEDAEDEAWSGTSPRI